jgi:prevent-host-death family protein
MTHSSVNVTDARDNLSEILGRVKFGQEIVTIEKKGKPYAVIISPAQYEALQKAARERFGRIVGHIQSRNAHFSAEEVMRDVNEETEAVRGELYGRGD